MAIRSEVTLDTTKARGEARRASNEIAKSMSSAAGGESVGSGFLRGAESGVTKVSSAINVLSMAYRGLVGVIDNADTFGDLNDSIASLLPATKSLSGEMNALADLAARPGLEFNSVVKAHSRFLALGKSSEQSMEIIKEIGNALQLGGGDPTQLNEIVGVLTKMTDSGEPNIKMLHNLTEQMPIFRQAFKAAFGTDSVSEIEAMHMSGEQFVSSFTIGLQSLGTAAKDSKDRLGDIVDDMKFIAGAAATGILDALFGEVPPPPPREQLKESQDEIMARSKAMAQERVLRMKDLEDEVDRAKELALAKQQEAAIQNRIDAGGDTSPDIYKELEAAKQKTDALELQTEVWKSILKLQKEHGMSQEEALALIQREVEAKRAVANNEKELARAEKERIQIEKEWNDIQKVSMEERIKLEKEEAERMEKWNEMSDRDAKKQSDDASQRAIASARASGKDRRADKLQRASDLNSATNEGLEMDLSPEAAAVRAKDILKTREDQAYRDRTGRARIHGGGPQQGFGGIDGFDRSSPLGLQGRTSDAAFPMLDRMPKPNLQTTQLTQKEQAAMRPEGNPELKEVNGNLKEIKALLQTAVGKDAAKPLSAA